MEKYQNKINNKIVISGKNNSNNVVSKQNKQNMINKSKNTTIVKVTKNKKNKKDNPDRFEPEYIVGPHKGIKSLELFMSTPLKPRKVLHTLYINGFEQVENVTFYVKGKLNDSMITVTNICSCTHLLSDHCNLVLNENQVLEGYIGKVVTCDIKLYEYKNGKYSFNIVDSIKKSEYTVGATIDFNLNHNVTYSDETDLNNFINNIIKDNIKYKIDILNNLHLCLSTISEILYNNGVILTNMILSYLFMDSDIDSQYIYKESFVNVYFYDIAVIFVRVLYIYDKSIKNITFNDIRRKILGVISIYTDSPLYNNNKITLEFEKFCTYLGVSSKQAQYHYAHNNVLIKDGGNELVRVEFIKSLKSDLVSFICQNYDV